MPEEAHHDRFLSLLEENKKILYKVAGSYCRTPADRQDLVASRSRRIVPAGDSILEFAAADSGDSEHEEQLRLLHRFIRQLDELDRALVVLYLDGNSYETIGDILGISETNVGTKIGRIKQRLRRDVARTA